MNKAIAYVHFFSRDTAWWLGLGTAAIHVRATKVAMSPMAVPGGGGVLLSVFR